MASTVGPKDIAEDQIISFPFSEVIPADSTLSSVDMEIVATPSARDATPESVLNGLPFVVGRDAYQRVHAGVEDVSYHIRAIGTDSDGYKHTIAVDMRVVRF